MPITINIHGESADQALYELRLFTQGMLKPETSVRDALAQGATFHIPKPATEQEIIPPTTSMVPPAGRVGKRTRKTEAVAETPPAGDPPSVITVEQLQAENGVVVAEPTAEQLDIENAADIPPAQPQQDFDDYAKTVRALLASADLQGLKPITEDNARLCRDGIQKLYDTHGDEAARESLKLFSANKVSELRDAHTQMFGEYVRRLKEELSKQKGAATREARKSK